MGISENTVRSLLRRLRSAVPSVRTVAWHGEAGEVFSAVAAGEGVEPQAVLPDAEIYFLPDSGCVPPAPSEASVVLVLARSVGGEPLPHLHARRPARHSLPLTEWVRGWAGPSLARLLVSPAVGGRPISVRWPGREEWIFLRDISPASRQPLGEVMKFLLVTYLGTGMASIMPATVASIFLLPPAFAILMLGDMGVLVFVSLIVAVLATIASIALEKWASRRFLAEDPREFVLDEVAGLALAWACLPSASPWWAILVAFAAFRVFDIFKWGVKWVEKLPIPGRVVWDDLLAGLYAGLLTWLIVR